MACERVNALLIPPPVACSVAPRRTGQKLRSAAPMRPDAAAARLVGSAGASMPSGSRGRDRARQPWTSGEEGVVRTSAARAAIAASAIVPMSAARRRDLDMRPAPTGSSAPSEIVPALVGPAIADIACSLAKWEVRPGPTMLVRPCPTCCVGEYIPGADGRVRARGGGVGARLTTPCSWRTATGEPARGRRPPKQRGPLGIRNSRSCAPRTPRCAWTLAQLAWLGVLRSGGPCAPGTGHHLRRHHNRMPMEHP
jgi:hypothetical protein